MATGKADIIQIIESQAELRTDQWVGRGIKLACHAVRLEAKYAGSYKINIVSPASNNWVAFD